MRQSSIKKTAIIIMSVAVIEKILGFSREMIIASRFGATGLTDAYIGGFLIPNFIMVLMNAGLINVYAPVFLSEMNIDEDNAWKRINSVSVYILIIVFLFSTVGFLFSSNIVAALYPGFSKENLNAASSISRIFFIGIFVYTGSIIEGALLNCFRYFIYPLISIGLLSAGIILFVILFGGNYNINSIAYGYLAGAFIGLLIQYIKLKRTDNRFGFNFTPYKDFNSKFMALMFPVLFATSMSQINVFIDRIFASYLPEGSMSYLTYSNKVTELPITLFSGIIATIIFPDIINYVNINDKENLKIYINKAIIITLILLVPSFAGLTVLSREIIKLLYQRNMFNTSDTLNTASALLYYSPTIILYGCTAIISKVYYSIKDTTTLMYISILTIFLNVILDYVLMKPMAHNGLALATSIVAIFQYFCAYYILKKKVDLSMNHYLIKNIIKICLSSAVMGIILYIMKSYIPVHSALLLMLILIIIGATVYFVMLKIVKVDELEILEKKIKH